MRRLYYLIIMIFVLLSCEKRPFDNRIKYVVGYDLVQTRIDRYNCIDTNYVGCENVIITSYSGEISISKNERDGIYMDIPNYGWFLKIDSRGKFDSNSRSGPKGSFGKDGSIRFYFKHGSPGSSISGSTSVVGNKRN